jgi:rhomboid protease GluP
MWEVDKRRMCPNCRAFVTSDDKTCPYCDIQLGTRIIDKRKPDDILGGLIPHARFTTVIILLINLGLYAALMSRSARLSFGGAIDLSFDALYDLGAKARVPIIRGEWWRLITAGFLHGGFFHIFMNSWALFDLGTQVEETYGTSRYLAFYFIANLTGFLASFYWTPALSVGASAAIFGLIGAMLAFGVRDRTRFGDEVRSTYSRWAVYSLLFGLLPGFAVDNAAHLGGLAGGFVMAYIAGTPTMSRAVERFWQVVAVLCVLITLYAFAQVFIRTFAPQLLR